MPIKKRGNIENHIRNWDRLKKRIPHIAGQEGVNFFKERFRKQGWRDRTLRKWPRRKRQDEGRGILVKSGRLKRSIRVTQLGILMVRVGTDVPYAQVHNEGDRITGTQNVRRHTRETSRGRSTVMAHTRQVDFAIPQRQFIGKSVTLHRRIEQKVIREMRIALN